ncbi:Plasmodium exported protein (PHIST), unknown function [Plasmodium malariae]|uniref:Plasmodium RESA N-terminal domain-containing protein n=1 Tax=Plasmodium malariae TaxID=5858 RepID=A0A1A8WVT4_PLAMA|nr:Plasmodium exported protein (PHIST), unknown function [Plasmodium malariae]
MEDCYAQGVLSSRTSLVTFRKNGNHGHITNSLEGIGEKSNKKRRRYFNVHMREESVILKLQKSNKCSRKLNESFSRNNENNCRGYNTRTYNYSCKNLESRNYNNSYEQGLMNAFQRTNNPDESLCMDNNKKQNSRSDISNTYNNLNENVHGGNNGTYNNWKENVHGGNNGTYNNWKENVHGGNNGTYNNLNENVHGGNNGTYNNLNENVRGGNNGTYNNLNENVHGGNNGTYNNLNENVRGGNNSTYNNLNENVYGGNNGTYNNLNENVYGGNNGTYNNWNENVYGGNNGTYNNLNENVYGGNNGTYNNQDEITYYYNYYNNRNNNPKNKFYTYGSDKYKDMKISRDMHSTHQMGVDIYDEENRHDDSDSESEELSEKDKLRKRINNLGRKVNLVDMLEIFNALMSIYRKKISIIQDSMVKNSDKLGKKHNIPNMYVTSHSLAAQKILMQDVLDFERKLRKSLYRYINMGSGSRDEFTSFIKEAESIWIKFIKSSNSKWKYNLYMQIKRYANK